jgi:hypothetical protein
MIRVTLAACAAVLALAPRADAQPPDADRREMMRTLGISSLRPGPSGDEHAPNAANYDEAKANPYPDLPDPLRLTDGRRVTTPTLWWREKRPQIVRDYEREVYGRVPAGAPKVHWTVTATDREELGFGSLPVIARRVVGHAEAPGATASPVEIQMMVVTPADAKGPVPLLVMFTSDFAGGAAFPAPNLPSRDEYGRIDAALKAVLARQDPSLAKVFVDHPGLALAAPPPFKFPERNADGDPPNLQELTAAGWGFALLDAGSIQPDNAEGLARGVIGLSAGGRPRRPDDWGVLRAWAWGASRALDHLQADPAVDARRIGVEGVSRYGKAALLAMAMDPRFAVVLVGSSGKGGATPLRRDWGEDVANLATGEAYWMAGNFLKYDGPLHPGDLPVDSDELIALCAPRPTFISYGVPEKGDAKWLDHRGSYMATVAASPVFTLLGAKGLQDAPADYRTARMPPVNAGLLAGDLAWRQHDGGHTDAPNMKYFIAWADQRLGIAPPPATPQP